MFVQGAPEVRAYLREVNHGQTRDGINTRQLLDLPVLLPHPNEQDRIVAEIEKQFTRLESATLSLRRARQGLAAWRIARIRAGMHGRLVPTEAELARSSGRPFEDASALLRRLNARVSVQEVESPYPLPEGWTWTQLAAVAKIKGGLAKGEKRKPTDTTRTVPYLRVANVQRGYLDLDEVKSIEATEAQIRDLQLQPGDLLFNEGGDRDKLGRGWVWHNELSECIHQNHVFRARLLSELQPRFFSLFANFVGHRYFFDEGKQTTNLASINISKLSRLPVPVAPAAEQTRIVDELDRQFSVLAHVTTLVEEQFSRAAALRRGILRDAFAGQLAAQTDTPAPIGV